MSITRDWKSGLGALVLAVVAGCASNPERKYLSGVRQITFHEMGLVNAGEAYFAPDGQSIVFQATPVGQSEYQIYTMELKRGARPRMVSTGRGACTCAFFRPDGGKIIFASSHLDPTLDGPRPVKEKKGYEWDFNAHMDVFEADVDGGNLRRLTEAPGYDAECAYSPDGRSIVFTSQRDGDLELYVMDADGGNQRRLTHAPGYDGGPFFSPDGRLILYRGDRRNDGKQNLQIRMIDAEGRNDWSLTDNAVFNWCPYWYPDGRSFIFTRADHEAYARGEKPNYDLYLAQVPGAAAGEGGRPAEGYAASTPLEDRLKLQRITFDEAFDGLPVFSPDGRRLMWTSKRGGLDEAQVFIADFKMPESAP